MAGTRLVVSPDGRSFVTDRGEPFFCFGDVAWTLLKRLDRSEVAEYFANRVEKGFSVIHSYVLRGLETPNLYGDLTLVDGDPSRPNEAFFRNVDFIVRTANDMGLVIGLVVTYGAHVRHGQKNPNEHLFDPASARAYAEFLGSRYRSQTVIWYLGGDRQPEDRDIWIAMAGGLKHGSGGAQLVSYHGPGPRDLSGYSSSHAYPVDTLDPTSIVCGHVRRLPTGGFGG